MYEDLSLPTGEELAKLIHTHVERERSRMNFRIMMWSIGWYYINGYRNFTLMNAGTGEIRSEFLSKDHKTPFQLNLLTSLIDRTSGRLAALDLRPKVELVGMSLPAVRSRAVGQIIADSVVSEDQLEQIKTQYAHIFVALGSCGLCGHVVDHPTVGLTGDLEVVHPQEVFPFPSLDDDYTKVCGRIRERLVPLEWLRKKYPRKFSQENKNKAHIFRRRVGDIVSNKTTQVAASSSTNRFADGMASPKDGEAEYILIREAWFFGTRGTVAKYALCSGELMIDEQDHKNAEVYCPMSFERFMESGTFHGIGLIDLLFALHRENEKLIEQLLANIQSIDRYGVVLMPNSMGTQEHHLRDIGHGLRVLNYEPDAVGDSTARPIAIQPFNSGDTPGKWAQFMQNLFEQMSPIRDLIEEKGRIDSAAGLAFLDEQMARAMTTSTRGISRAFGSAYREIIRRSAATLQSAPRAINVSRLTLDLAGAVIDPEENTVSFRDNPLPTVSHLTFTVRETTPRSEAARFQQAVELTQANVPLMDPLEFRLFIAKEGLDAAMFMEGEKAAYETVVRNILILYGDGEQPSGEFVVAPYLVMPELQLKVLLAFMGSPLLSLASAEVINEFRLYREFLMSAGGWAAAEGMPSPQDAALLNPQPPAEMQPQESPNARSSSDSE